MPTQDEKPDIYPPSIIDPLKPGGIPSTPDGTEKPYVDAYHANLGPVAPGPDAAARDAYLGELAREAISAEKAKEVVEALRFLQKRAPQYLNPDTELVEQTIKAFEALARDEDPQR
jgi:hypothetical protein